MERDSKTDRIRYDTFKAEYVRLRRFYEALLQGMVDISITDSNGICSGVTDSNG